MATDALLPAIGDIVRICAEVGVYGHGDFRLRVLGVVDALACDHCYVRGYRYDDPGKPATYYVRTSHLEIERDVW